MRTDLIYYIYIKKKPQLETMESSIAETFRNGTVLITGGTGFLGKTLAEKLLRSCAVRKIALLVRNNEKEGRDNTNQRITGMFKQRLFDSVRQECPDFTNRIKIVDGNVENEFLDLRQTDIDWIIDSVDFVFHCAATIKFNEPLERAAKINVEGTENVLLLASKIKNLKGFVHVSTAYSHCTNYEIREQYYPVPMTAEELKISTKTKRRPASNSVENWPNTYTFTKAIAENLISTNDGHLPISIFRPSIIGCTQVEPFPGWMDNLNGPFGMVTGIVTGLLKTITIDTDKITDMVPVDYTANALIGVIRSTGIEIPTE